MTTPIRLNPSNSLRRGTTPIHAGYGLFVEKTRGSVSPLCGATTNKGIHIYMFIRRIELKPLSMRLYPVDAILTNCDELKSVDALAVENVDACFAGVTN